MVPPRPAACGATRRIVMAVRLADMSGMAGMAGMGAALAEGLGTSSS